MFDVAAARAALTCVDWAQPMPPAGVLAEYARYYGLDFGGRVAGLRHGMGYLDVATPLPSDCPSNTMLVRSRPTVFSRCFNPDSAAA